MDRARIFCIDDDPVTLEFLNQTLSPKYEVHTCADPTDAINRLVACDPQLVLLDILMPEVDGAGVLDLIRMLPDYRKLPVVLLTANADEADLDIYTRLGVRGLIEKGESPADLLQSVDYALTH